MMVCMCCVSNCEDKWTGKECIICKEYVVNLETKMVPWDSENARCMCNVCRCNCGVYFPRSKWQIVKLQVREREEEKAKRHAVGAARKKKNLQNTLDQMVNITKRAMDQNGLSSAPGFGLSSRAKRSTRMLLRGFGCRRTFPCQQNWSRILAVERTCQSTS